jgi:uncharacterized protein (TIGR03437 family)
VDSSGNIFIADSVHCRVREVSPAGIISTVAGNGGEGYSGDGGLATLASLFLPSGLAVDPAGSLIIADEGNHRVRMVTPDGKINTIAGGGTNGQGNNAAATSAVLEGSVSGVAFGSGGSVYISSVVIVAGTGLQVLKPTGNTLSPAPSIPDSGVASASGWGQFSQLGLGSWVSIYGSYLATDARSWAASDFTGVSAPTSLDGTSVTIGGQPAFISYISPGQINAQVPSNIGTGAQPLIIKTAAGTSATYAVTVNSQEPGLLAPASFQIGATQYVVALFQDGVTYALPTGALPGVSSRPAKAGDILTLYGIGFGRVVPETTAGQIVQTAATLATPFQLFFSSTAVPVSYAGLAPGAVGLYQINVTVPSRTFGGRASLSFTLSGVSSTQYLSIAVQ